MSRLGARVRPETLLRSLAPFVAMVQSTDAWQCHDLRRGRRSWRDRSLVRSVFVETQVAAVR